MHTPVIRSVVIGLALTTLVGASSMAVAETIAYKAELNASNEFKPNESNGTGAAEVTYDTATKTLTWTLTFEGLTGPATAAHFHGPATPGQEARVVIPIGNNPTSPAKGTATLTDAQAADLQAGRWYVNVHTAANPGGEIRGQVVK